MRDILAGAFLAGFALLFVIPGFGYGIGTMGRPGAGGVPFAVGAIMLILAGGIALGGVRNLQTIDQRIGFNPERLRHISFVMAAIALFALGIERLGLMPSTALAVIVSSLADRQSRLSHSCLLAVIMCVIIWAIFKLGLQVNTPLFESPF